MVGDLKAISTMIAAEESHNVYVHQKRMQNKHDDGADDQDDQSCHQEYTEVSHCGHC